MEELEEQASWKGHGFTLVVFAGIVVLCAIFFVLGMTVGRQQGQKTALAAGDKSAAKTAASEARAQSETDKAELSSYAGVETNKTATLVPEPVPEPKKVEPPVTPTPSVVQADPPPTSAAKPVAKASPAPPVVPAQPSTPQVKSIYWQVDALTKATAATKEVDELRKKGFSSILVDPSGTSKLYSVRVGPFSNAADAEMAKAKLEALGYKPIKK